MSPSGAIGATGATGATGPTASSAVSRDQTVAQGGTFLTSYIDLYSINSEATDNQITTTFPGRIIAIAIVTATTTSGAGNSGVAMCKLQISDGTGQRTYRHW